MTAEPAAEFERHRGALGALAYRMLGDAGQAEDMVQEAWLRYARAADRVEAPRLWLAKVVTRLCLNELASARQRHERAAGPWLPEPVAAEPGAAEQLERAEQISMALLVALQRLSPPERAVLLLAEVVGLSHAEISELLGRTEPACRQILRRARSRIAGEKRRMRATRESHARLLAAFLEAARAGDVVGVVRVLAEDAVLYVDAGSEGRTWGRVRALPGPLSGREKVAAFVARVAPQGDTGLEVRPCTVLGEPALLVLRAGAPTAAVMVTVDGGRIARVFIHADPARLLRLARSPG